MREKKQNMKDAHDSEMAKRLGVLKRLNNGIGPRRENISAAEAVPPVMKPSPKILLDELAGDVDGSLLERWPTIVQAKANDISQQVHQMVETVEGFDLICDGYGKKFGLTIGTRGGGNDIDKVGGVDVGHQGSGKEASAYTTASDSMK